MYLAMAQLALNLYGMTRASGPDPMDAVVGLLDALREKLDLISSQLEQVAAITREIPAQLRQDRAIEGPISAAGEIQIYAEEARRARSDGETAVAEFRAQRAPALRLVQHDLRRGIQLLANLVARAPLSPVAASYLAAAIQVDLTASRLLTEETSEDRRERYRDSLKLAAWSPQGLAPVVQQIEDAVLGLMTPAVECRKHSNPGGVGWSTFEHAPILEGRSNDPRAGMFDQMYRWHGVSRKGWPLWVQSFQVSDVPKDRIPETRTRTPSCPIADPDIETLIAHHYTGIAHDTTADRPRLLAGAVDRRNAKMDAQYDRFLIFGGALVACESVYRKL